MDITIIGGGISGLAAAWELSSRPDLSITVFEASDRLGGKISTVPFAGRAVDLGPDAFLRRVPDALALCAEVGLDDLIAPAHSVARVWLDGTLVPLPPGLVLGVPARFDSLADSGTLSAEGLRRARSEPQLPGLPIDSDRSVGELIRSRFGDEVAERLVGPLLGGIAAGDIDSMSVDACVPQLAAAARSATSMSQYLASTPSASPGPVFAAPANGMQVLIDTLVEQLTARGVTFRLGEPIDRLPDADGVVLTTAAPVSARLLSAVSSDAAAVLSSIDHASVVFTALAFDTAVLPDALDGSGFLVPRTAGLSITAASWSSSKWERLAGDPVILRVSMGHAHDPAAIDRTDTDVLERIVGDLRTTMGITANPVEARIARYRDGFPQYTPGHLDRIDEMERTLERDAPRVVVSGMALRGVGIPACIREARRAAATLADRIRG